MISAIFISKISLCDNDFDTSLAFEDDCLNVKELSPLLCTKFETQGYLLTLDSEVMITMISG